MGESYIQSQLELLKILPNSTSDEVFTGEGVALEIVTSLVSWIEPDIFKNPSSKFLDIYTKSGIFLLLLYEVLMENLADTIEDEGERSNHILSNMLYGISPSSELALVSRKTLYGNWITEGNIKYLQGYKDKVKKGFKGIDKELGTMKFDVVIGNPPYNNDVYLDFVTLAHQLSSQYTCMITPAKWQAKGGEKNEKFRRDIVPYMSHIVYYPNTPDVFYIGEAAGISYYLIDKVGHSDLELRNKCKINNNLNRKFSGRKSEIKTLELCGKTIIEKMPVKKLNIKGIDYTKKYKVFANNLVGLSGGGGGWKTCLFSKDSKTNFLGKCAVTQSLLEEQTFSHNYTVIFSALTFNECENFVSYINTKLIRFLLYCGRCGNSVTNNETWRFVPDPGPFDHIFTDEELYQKYNLTPDEINIIESVIKERKPRE